MAKLASQRGQILPLVGITVAVMLGAAGFAVDAGFHQYEQRMQQTATDSAALAGALELMSGNYVAAARQDAATNGFADNTGSTSCPSNAAIGTVCVVVHNPPQSGDVLSGNTNAVEVDITAFHPTFFERIFQINKVPVTTKAVAVLKQKSSGGCVYVLDPKTAANFNGTTGGNVNTPSCSLVLNGGANFNNQTVNAAAINCAATCSGGTFTGAQPATTSPTGDPCSQITSCAYVSKNPPTCAAPATPPQPDLLGQVNLPAGCYNGFTYHQGLLTNPLLTVNVCGLYVVTGTADISATGLGVVPINIRESPGCPGVTFYMTGNGAVNFRNANMNLNAPQSGDYSQYAAGEQGILFYQTPGDTQTANLQSASCLLNCNTTINGMMYFPSANLNYNKASSTLNGSSTLIVSYDLNCNGCLAGAMPAPSNGSLTQETAVLGE